MAESLDFEDDYPRGHIKLKEGIDIKSLLEGKGDTFEVNFENIDINDEPEKWIEPNKEEEKAMMELTGACLGVETEDEDTNEVDTTAPFDKLAQNMINVTNDEKIKKLVKKSGVGPSPPDNSLVSIKYSSYLEYNDSPVDTAFMIKPYQFRLGYACIIGLNIAVQSMKLNETSWFLIHPDYAFGAMGHPPRIPPNATFLFCIELLRFVDSGPALQLDEMSIEDKRKFSKVYVTAKGLMEHAKEYFSHNVKLAIREYNKAMNILEECNLSNMEEQEKQQQLLFRIYLNLAVCYTKDNAPKKACTMCNNIFDMSKNTSLKIPAKLYFQNGRALYMLGDYKRAYNKLRIAAKLEKNNNEINEELKKVLQKLKEEENREKKLARAFLRNTENPKEDISPEITEDNDFAKEIRNQCKMLLNSVHEIDIKLPWGLTRKERDTAKFEAEYLGLKFKEVELTDEEEERSGQIVYIISKV